MKKITFLLLLSAFALFAEDPSPAQGHYELSPLDWKGKITLSLTGYLPAEGLSEVLSNGIIGLYNLNDDIFVGMKVVPEMQKNNCVFRDKYSEFIYKSKSGKFTYKDRYAEDWLSILTYNAEADMYYSNPLAQGIGKIKGQGKINVPLMPYFNDDYGITLFNSDTSKTFAVSDSIVTMMDGGKSFSLSDEPYKGTKVKVTVKKTTGKVTYKMKIKKEPSNPNYTSLVPSLIWFVEDPIELQK
ncbi:hypothetical protein IKS73_08185 [bacterium]|nr:hypothetical protein [bacterium]